MILENASQVRSAWVSAGRWRGRAGVYGLHAQLLRPLGATEAFGNYNREPPHRGARHTQDRYTVLRYSSTDFVKMLSVVCICCATWYTLGWARQHFFFFLGDANVIALISSCDS